ncbi:MAG TPA: hypothetical protein VEW28_05340 [Candidatus Kapabacteria bacterium]|nr:hypothetical protein [Candidatus Kapabacteria bacterium]
MTEVRHPRVAFIVNLLSKLNMTIAARSALVHGIYALAGGLSLLIFPNMLALIGFDPQNDLWLRVFGLEVAVLGFFYLRAAQEENTQFFKASVIGRLSFTLILFIMVVLGLSKINLVLLGVPDFFTAIWTLIGLRNASTPTT